MNIWVLLIRFSWIALGVLALILCVSLFLPQVNQYHELQRRKAELEEEIRLEERIVIHLKRQQERLESDPKFVERIAREEYGLAKPGETVFRFIDDDKGAAEPAP